MWAMKGNSTCCFLEKKLSWWPGQIKSRCLTDSLLSLLLREIFFLCTSFPSCSYLWLVEDPNDLRLKLFLSLIASLDNKSSGLVARLFTTDTTTTSSSTFKSIPDNNPFWPTFLTRIYSFFKCRTLWHNVWKLAKMYHFILVFALNFEYIWIFAPKIQILTTLASLAIL